VRDERVKIISEIIEAPPEKISESSDFVTEFAVNSLQRMQILDEIECRLNVNIPVSDGLKRMRSVSGIEELLEELQR